MKILHAHFSDRDEQHAKDFIENHSEQSPSSALRDLVLQDNEKFAHNTILSNHVQESKELEQILKILSDVDFWNNAIRRLNPEQLRNLESSTHSILSKTSDMLKYGTMNVR